jgi:hypothetical protein
MPKKFSRPFLPVIILFIVLNGFFISGNKFMERWNFDQTVLVFGNLILFAVTFLSFRLGQRGMRTTNPHAVVRSVYASFVVKFFICITAAFVYILFEKKNLNKPGLIACLGLYVGYTFLEVSILMKLSKQKKNA